MKKNNLETISSNTKGLPDCWHIDGSGKSVPEVFSRHFGLPRKYRHDRKGLDASMDRKARLSQFFFALLHYRKLSTAILLEGDKYASPEAHALARFDEGWHLRRQEDLLEFAMLSVDDRDHMWADLRQVRQSAAWKNHQTKAQALANRDNTTIDQVVEDMAGCAIESWLRARQKLRNWSSLGEDDRRTLAEAIFCGFTFFGKRALEEALAVEPEVLIYYRSFLGMSRMAMSGVSGSHSSPAFMPLASPISSVPQQVSALSALTGATERGMLDLSSRALLHDALDGTGNDNPRADIDCSQVNEVAVVSRLPNIGSDEPRSLRHLYSLIAQIGQCAHDDDCAGPEPALSIKNLIDTHLQRLIERNARLPGDEVLRLIERYCAAVLEMTDALEFAHSDQRELVPVLLSAWRVAVTSALKEGQSQAWFELNLADRRDLPEFVVRFQEQKAKITQASAEIETIRSQLVDAKYTARTALRASETRKQSEINAAQGELDTIRVEAAHHLTPEGRTLDDLMEDETLQRKIEVDVDALRGGAVKALQTIVRLLETTSIARPDSALEDQVDPSAIPSSGAIEPAAPESAPASAPVLESQVAAAGKASLSQSVPDTIPASVQSIVGRAATQEQTVVLPAASDPDADSCATEKPFDFPAKAGNSVDGEVDSGIPALAAATDGLVAALWHLQPADSKEEAQKAFRIAYDQFSRVPSSVLEAVALHWLDGGHLNVAHQILRDAKDTTLVTGRVLDAALLRSAFYGMNLWPRDLDALSHTQRDLNLINFKDLEEQLERKPSGKLVPYLIVCATLQPALFVGQETPAPSLLRLSVDYFDGALKQLLANVSEFTMRGGRVDLDALRDVAGQESHMVATRLQDQVRAWVDINAHRTTRWKPLRVAMRICVKKPLLAAAIKAIEEGEKGDVSAVRLFVSTYSDHGHTHKLLDDLLDEIRADYSGPSSQADSPAYAAFQQQIDSLIAIAQEWVLEVAPSEMRQKDVGDFVKRFHTQLDRSIAQLMGHPHNSELEHRAGSNLLLKALTSLRVEIKGDGPAPWRFDQTDAAFRLPEVLSHLELEETGIDFRLDWFAMRLTSPNWLGDMIDLAKRHNAHWMHLLLLRQLPLLEGQHDADIEGVNTKIAGTRADLKKAIEHFKSLSIQAVSTDVAVSDDAIPEDEHLANMLQASEWLEKLKDYKPYVDVTPLEDEVKRLSRALSNQLNSMAMALEEELNQGLLNLRTRLGPDAVPEGWEARARAALERRNLTVVRELVNQLQDHLNRNAHITAHANQDNPDLLKFLEVETHLYTLLHEHPSPREAGERVIHERPGGLEYSVERSTFKDTVETLLEWRSRGQNKKPTLEKRTYEGIVEVLEFIGFTPVDTSVNADTLRNCEYSTTGDFRRLKVRIGRPILPKGFPIFEGDHFESVPLNVIFVQGSWNLSGLIELVERHGLPAKPVLMVGAPLSSDERQAFSRFCRDHKYTFFLLDPVVLSYLATIPNHQTLKSFLHVTAAWTFYNPYTKGDARQPAPPEMRFGRERDITSLVEPRGAALVYGGRQLGKTTLLHSAVQKFRQIDPKRNHAFYLRRDSNQHAVERDINVKTRVLEQLVIQLTEAGLLSASSQSKPAEERLQAEFQRNGETRVLFCLDEIDSVLDQDARTNFQLVRTLAALVNDPHQRFRVVLAGLQNVNRFRTMPNVPLEQLGSPLQVTILSAAEARSLIVHPLAALGFSFEDDVLVDRIMAFTNCHPSLLHIFCSELVEQLALDRSAKGGLRVIRNVDLDNIESNSDVRRLSGMRVDMTLNLDLRYAVAIYGLIRHYGKGISKFTVRQALEVARELVPEEFEQMSEAAFESLLQELIGLGVLRQIDKETHQYAVRNQSILQLIGSSEIARNLDVAKRDLADRGANVLTCHPAGANLLPSPLSLQDERQLLRAKSPDGAPNFSVSVIMGSSALGVSVKWIEEGFKVISEFRSGNASYETRRVTETQYFEPKRFQELIKTAISDWSLSKPVVLLVPLDEAHTIDRIMDLLSIANESASRATKLKHELRIVFLMGPRAMWSWCCHPWITDSPEEIGGLVELNRWSRHACESLLDQQGLDVTPEQARLLYAATEGWYLALLKFIDVRKSKVRDRVSSFNDLTNDFTPVVQLTAKEFEKFVDHTGMDSVAWSMPLAAQLKLFDSLNEFSVEDLQIAIEFLDKDFQAHISPEQAAYVVHWWSGLRVIEANTKEASKNAGKGDKVTFRFTPAMQRAITESSLAALGAATEAQV